MMSLKKLAGEYTVSGLKIVVFTYHGLFPSSVRVCRYEPTCSDYLLEVVKKHGMISGSFLWLRRFISCSPLSKKPVIDPVP